MSPQKFIITRGLFMQNKCLYRILSLHERIDTTGEESIGSKVCNGNTRTMSIDVTLVF